MNSAPPQSFLARNEFLIRRLHSLSGLIPVGAYMCVHLVTNSLMLVSPAMFQRAVYQIHSLDAVLWVVEWLFIFLPILFHAVIGVMIIRGSLPNSGAYPYGSNVRYTLQRATGMIALVFIFFHVFHLHGWFHFDSWLKNAKELGGAQFYPYSAASSLGTAMQSSLLLLILYAIGMLSCVFHFANGVWTMGITWGVWITPAAQRRALTCCLGLGLVMAAIGLAALAGTYAVKVDEHLLEAEQQQQAAKIAAGEIPADSHKIKRPESHEGKTSATEKGPAK